MEKIKFVKTRNETSWGYQLNDGRIISLTDMVNGENKMILRYDTPFNPETGEMLDYIDNDKGMLPKGFTTLNRLKREGNGTEVKCYEEYQVFLGENPKMDDKQIAKIIAEFEDAGFKVTEKAIFHNFYAWTGSFKSGYRDEENGYHLFTPCGGNPFSLSATTLHELCSDWQTTYVW